MGKTSGQAVPGRKADLMSPDLAARLEELREVFLDLDAGSLVHRSRSDQHRHAPERAESLPKEIYYTSGSSTSTRDMSRRARRWRG